MDLKNIVGNIIFSASVETVNDLVSAAIRSGADLRSADLQYANLRSANLRSADLRGANIAYAILPDKFPMARLDFGGWSIWITPTHTAIGCQQYPNSDWLKWSPKDVAKFANGASIFWKQHGPVIKAAIKDVQSQARKK